MQLRSTHETPAKKLTTFLFKAKKPPKIYQKKKIGKQTDKLLQKNTINAKDKQTDAKEKHIYHFRDTCVAKTPQHERTESTVDFPHE